jgi:hypothetical protein
MFQPDTGVAALCQSNHVFGEAVVDMGDNPSLPPFEFLDGAVLSGSLQVLAASGIDTTDMRFNSPQGRGYAKISGPYVVGRSGRPRGRITPG